MSARRPARGLAVWLIAPLAILWPVGRALATLLGNLDRPLLDFRGGLYDAGRAVAHGHVPFRGAFLAHQAQIMRHGGVAIGESAAHVFSVPLYPVLADLLVVPLALLPYPVAAAIYTVLSLGAMVLALRLLGVRDPRCHAAVLISWPFLLGMVLGAIGPWLMLGVAAVWRWRDRVLVPALAIATLIAVKLFPWTLAVWLLISGRRRAFFIALPATVALIVLPWAAIGFHGLVGYPAMLGDATLIQEGRGDSVTTVALALGAPAAVAQTIALVLGLGVLALATMVARRPGGERGGFGLAVVACLVATPLVWDHYMVLLFVPIALLRPRLSALWALPLLGSTATTVAYMALPTPDRPLASPSGALVSALIWLVVETGVAIACVRPIPGSAPRAARRPARAHRRAPSGRRRTAARPA